MAARQHGGVGIYGIARTPLMARWLATIGAMLSATTIRRKKSAHTIIRVVVGGGEITPVHHLQRYRNVHTVIVATIHYAIWR